MLRKLERPDVGRVGRSRPSRSAARHVGKASLARASVVSFLVRRVGMSRDGLYKALSEDGNPAWSTMLKVTSALGLRFELHRVA